MRTAATSTARLKRVCHAFVDWTLHNIRCAELPGFNGFGQKRKKGLAGEIVLDFFTRTERILICQCETMEITGTRLKRVN